MVKISILVYFIFFILEKPCGLAARSNKKTGVLKYGDYLITTRAIEMCKKSIDMVKGNTTLDFTLKVMKLSRTREHYIGNVTFQKDVEIKSISMSIDIISNGKLMPEAKRKIENLCSNIAFSFILKKILKADSQCVVKKGTYTFENINVNEILHLLYPKFIYNQYVITIEWASHNEFSLCFKLMLDAKPLKAN